MSAQLQPAAEAPAPEPAQTRFDPERCPVRITYAAYHRNFQGEVESFYVFAPGSPAIRQGETIVYPDPSYTRWAEDLGNAQAMAMLAAARDQFLAGGARQRFDEIAARLQQLYEEIDVERRLATGYANEAREKLEELAPHDEVMRWERYAKDSKEKVVTLERQAEILKRMVTEEREKVAKQLYLALQQAGARFRAEHMSKADAIEEPARAAFLPAFAEAHKLRSIAGAISTDLLRMVSETVSFDEPRPPWEKPAQALPVPGGIDAIQVTNQIS